MGVDDAAQLRKFTIEQCVCVQIAGRAQRAFDDFSVQISNDHVGSSHALIADAAGLDDDQGLCAGAVDAADVAPGVWSESSVGDFAVCVENIFTNDYDLIGVHFNFVLSLFSFGLFLFLHSFLPVLGDEIGEGAL